MRKIILTLFLIANMVFAGSGALSQYVIIHKVHGSHILQFECKNDRQFNTAINGLKMIGESSDSLWFLWSWTIMDTTGNVTVSVDSLMNVTFEFRQTYDGINMAPAK